MTLNWLTEKSGETCQMALATLQQSGLRQASDTLKKCMGLSEIRRIIDER
jgi:hypothetical protein